MHLHFLLKAEARSLLLKKVPTMPDLEIFALFRHLLWGNGDEMVYPHCDTLLPLRPANLALHRLPE